MLPIYLAYIVPGSILIPLSLFVVRYRFTDEAERLIALYLVVSGLINLAAILLSNHHHSNLWLLHIYTCAETILLLLFFRKILTATSVRRLVNVMLVFFPLACLLNVVYFQRASLFNTYTRPAEALLCIGLSACYWVQDTGDREWATNPYNWIITGLFIYFAGSFLLFLFSNALLNISIDHANTRLWDLLWGTHATLVLVMYLLIAAGFRHRKLLQYG